MKSKKSKKIMTKMNFIVCSTILIFCLLFQLKNYYFNPILLPTSCVLGQIKTDYGSRKFMDCISCFSFVDKTSISNLMQGQIVLSLPPLNSSQNFVADIYYQQQCYEYECPDLRFGDDFSYATHKQDLSNLTFIKSASYRFTKYTSHLKQLISLLKKELNMAQGVQEQQKWIIQQVSNTKLSAHAFFIRYRYQSPLLSDTLPIMKFNYFSTSLEYRLIFCLLLLLNLSSFVALINKCNDVFKIIAIIFLSLAFLNDLFLAIASSICLFILCFYCGKIAIVYTLCINLSYLMVIIFNLFFYGEFLFLFFNLAVASFFITFEMEKLQEKDKAIISSLSITFGVLPVAWFYGITYFNHVGIYYILTILSYQKESWSQVNADQSLSQVDLQ